MDYGNKQQPLCVRDFFTAFPQHKATSHDSFRQTQAAQHGPDNRRASEPGYQEAGCPNSEQVSHCKVELASFVMADVGELLMSVLSTIRVPKPGDRVHKDECALSFSSPVSHFSFCKSKLQPMDSVAVLYSLPLS